MAKRKVKKFINEGSTKILSNEINELNKTNIIKPSINIQPTAIIKPVVIEPDINIKKEIKHPINPFKPVVIEPDINIKKEIKHTVNPFKPNSDDPYYSRPDLRTTKNTQHSTINQSLINALNDPDISDDIGLQRAYESENSVYLYKGTMYIAGTKTALGGDMIENIKYIGVPALKNSLGSIAEDLGELAIGVLPEVVVPVLAGIEVSNMIGRYTNNKTTDDKTKKDDYYADIENTTRYKEAEQMYLKNPDYIKKTVSDSMGAIVAERLNYKYNIGGGNAYGAPIVDVLGRAKIKNFLEIERENRNILYGTAWNNQPAKLFDNVAQNLLEDTLQLNTVKSTNETKITQYRTALDPVSIFNNSASTSVSSLSEIFENNTLTHSYKLTAKDHSASSETDKFANGFINKDNNSITLFA